MLYDLSMCSYHPQLQPAILLQIFAVSYVPLISNHLLYGTQKHVVHNLSENFLYSKMIETNDRKNITFFAHVYECSDRLCFMATDVGNVEIMVVSRAKKS